MQSIEYKEGVVISATELKQNLGKYLDFVEEQNDVVITKNGKKIARLTPYVTDIEQYFMNSTTVRLTGFMCTEKETLPNPSYLPDYRQKAKSCSIL